MSQDRNIKWLNDRRIIYYRNPITDIPTESTDLYDYYAEGTYQCYSLFRSKAKITTYKSLKWHLLVLNYLNYDRFAFGSIVNIFKFIADKDNGFVTFFIKQKILDKMISEVLGVGDTPPKNRIRKVIFKPETTICKEEKLRIVGELIGRSKRIHADDIYECMIDLNDMGKKITIGRIAGLLDCSSRTIHRNMCVELKREKELLNKQNEEL